MLFLRSKKLLKNNIVLWLLRNGEIKLVSVLIAILLWFHVTTEKEYDMTLEVPIIITKIKKEWIITNALPKSVTIRIKGKGKDAIRMEFRKPFVSLDLSVLPIGDYNRGLENGDLILPAGVNPSVINIVKPKTILVSQDTIIKKKLLVKASLEGELEDGFVLSEEPKIQPNIVDASGPKRVLERVEEIGTAGVDLEKIKSSLRQKISLNHKSVEAVRCIPDSVDLTLLIERLVEKSIEKVPVKIIDKMGKRIVSVEPKTVDILISARRKEIEEIKSKDVNVSIDISDKEKGEYLLLANIELPKGFSLISAKPVLFKVIIK